MKTKPELIKKIKWNKENEIENSKPYEAKIKQKQYDRYGNMNWWWM